jgi:hypothetical protein
MNITSGTSTKYSYYNWYKTHNYWHDANKELSKTLTDALVKFALDRLDSDIVEMIVTKGWICHIDRLCNDTNETLNDSTYQINFTNKNGVRISIDGVLLKKYRPFLDHGLSLDEGQ